MVKTDDFILMMEDGSCATATLTTTKTAVLMEKMVAEKVKNGGTDGKRGELLLESVDDAVAQRDVWLPGSQSPDTKCSSADFDQSDESGGDQSGGQSNGSHRNYAFSMDGRTNDRRIFAASINNEVDDRRLRRQIANCNERRRMQSINAGFQALRQLLPRKDGDKMSKAAILAATAEFIQSLLREKDKLVEENCAVMVKKRRMNLEETDKAILEEETVGPNVIECLRTIGDLQNSLQKETQLRKTYEKEMAELRCQLRLSPPSSALAALPPFPSPRPSSDFSPFSSSSPSSTIATGREGLLIEFVRQQEQRQQQQLLRHAAVLPSDVQLLTSAINSLTNCSPAGLALQRQQQQDSNISTNNGAMFVPTNEMPTGTETQQAMSQQPTTLFETKVSLSMAQQREMGTGAEMGVLHAAEGEVGTDATTTATISQQNLQALVLAIRHLEGSANASSSPLQKGHPPPAVPSSAEDTNLMLFQ